MFIVDINQLRRESKDLEFEIPVDSPLFEGTPVSLKKSVLVRLRASRHEEQTVFINGNLYSVLELSCRRCLETFDSEMTSEVMLIYQINSKGEPADTVADDEEEIIHIPYHTDEIDISEKLREILFVDYPTYPVCKEACAGICQSCGVNLNSEKCQCEESHIDERWTELQKLKYE